MSILRKSKYREKKLFIDANNELTNIIKMYLSYPSLESTA